MNKILNILYLFTKISGYVLLSITMLFAIHIFNLDYFGDDPASSEIFKKPTLILAILSFILIVISMWLEDPDDI